FLFTQSGVRTITVENNGLTTSTTVTVTAGAPATLDVSLSSSVVTDGDTVVATVTAEDAHGNDLGDVTADAVLTSDITADDIPAATSSVTVNGVGDHTITATIGSVSATAVVTAAPAPFLTISPSDDTVTAGDSIQFNVSRTALLVTTTVTATTTFASSNATDTQPSGGLFEF